MPLNVRVFDPPIRQVGNVAVIGGNNQPFRDDFITSFNYLINDFDYAAGSLQFITILQLQLAINNAAQWIQFRDAQPREYDLGSYSKNTAIYTLERGTISALEFAIIDIGRLITLDQNEAARPKLYRLSAAPRLIISKSATESFNIFGTIQNSQQNVTLNGSLSGPSPGLIALTGTTAPFGPTTASMSVNRRTLTLDSTDGRLDFTTTDSPPGVRNGSQYNSLADIVQLRDIGIFLRPGITGTAKLTIFKAGETNSSLGNPNNVYIPGVLPSI
jgi:hypothetical protein